MLAPASAKGEAPPGPAGGGDKTTSKDKDAGNVGDALAARPPKCKPKCLLSVYNLFYCYKRLKVFEDPSKSQRGRPHPTYAGAASSLDTPDKLALIRSVLVALPRVIDGVPPGESATYNSMWSE